MKLGLHSVLFHFTACIRILNFSSPLPMLNSPVNVKYVYKRANIAWEISKTLATTVDLRKILTVHKPSNLNIFSLRKPVNMCILQKNTRSILKQKMFSAEHNKPNYLIIMHVFQLNYQISFSIRISNKRHFKHIYIYV